MTAAAWVLPPILCNACDHQPSRLRTARNAAWRLAAAAYNSPATASGAAGLSFAASGGNNSGGAAGKSSTRRHTGDKGIDMAGKYRDEANGVVAADKMRRVERDGRWRNGGKVIGIARARLTPSAAGAQRRG